MEGQGKNPPSTPLLSCGTAHIAIYLDHSAIYLSRDSLAVLQIDAEHLTQTLGFSAQLADNVSGKIRHLDNAKQRVEESLQRIKDVLDLRFCTEGVQVAMQNEEYEVAAGHIQRFLKMDEGLLRRSAEEMKQQDNLHESLSLIHESNQKLKTIINSKFEEALNSGDSANVERLFKIFPLMNLHEQGLKKFCTYLCSEVRLFGGLSVGMKSRKIIFSLAVRRRVFICWN